MDFNVHNVQSKIVGAIYESGRPAAAIVPLGYQAYLAAVLLVIAAILGGLFVTSSNKQAVPIALAAASSLSFGSVFLINAVRVYAG